jgi:hypothetical protein
MSGEGFPTFEVRKTADGMEFYILIVWPNGDLDRINFFRNREEAERWIEQESAAWVLRRIP